MSTPYIRVMKIVKIKVFLRSFKACQICPECGEEMRIVGIVTGRPVINKILDHLGLIEKKSHSPPEEAEICLELTCTPYYVDLSSVELD